MKQPAIFISYSHRDTDFVSKFAQDLRSQVGSIWIDSENIVPGQYWDDEIEKGISEANVVLAMLSANTLSSPNCKDEYDAASRWTKPVIPVLIEEFDTNKLLWVRIGRKQWVDLSKDYYSGLQLLLKAIAFHSKSKLLPTKICPICDRASDTESHNCPSCGKPYLPQNLGQLHKAQPNELQKYLTKLAPRIDSSSVSIEDMIAVALL
jgi:hypothetical protein